VGFALLAVLGAERRSGVDTVLDLVGLDDRLTGADLVITGEGSLDAQTLRGKAPSEVARRASRFGVPCLGLAGRVLLDADALDAAGFTAAAALTEVEPDVARCLAEPAAVLADLAAAILAR